MIWIIWIQFIHLPSIASLKVNSCQVNSELYKLIVMPSWKDVQSAVKVKRKTKLALLVLGLVSALLILGQLIHFTQILFRTERNQIWNGEFNLNLVIRAKSISYFSYNPQDKKVVILEIPDETYLEVPHGFGKWQLRAVYDLGGAQLLTDTLTNFLGLPIDGFLDFKGPFKESSTLQLLEELGENPLHSNLSLWELIRLKLALMQVRFDKIETRAILDLGVLEQDKLADGTPIFLSDPVRLDSALSAFAEPKLLKEHQSIAIFNATNHPQLAQKAARIITNMGGNVIITANWDQALNKCQIFGEQSKTLQRLLQIFDCDRIDPGKDSRAQINLFLGEDYSLRQ